MSRRPVPAKKASVPNPFAADDDDGDASNPFSADEEEEEEEQQRPPPRAKASRPMKHQAPSFDDDEEEEAEEESPASKPAWKPPASSPFARQLPPAAAAPAEPKKKSAVPAAAKKAAAAKPAVKAVAAKKAEKEANPFAAHDDDDVEVEKEDEEEEERPVPMRGRGAKAEVKAAETNPFSPTHSSSAAAAAAQPAVKKPAAAKAEAKAVDSNPFSPTHSASAAPAAAKKADSNPFAAPTAPAAAAGKKADSNPFATAAPAAAAVAGKKADSNPFATPAPSSATAAGKKAESNPFADPTPAPVSAAAKKTDSNPFAAPTPTPAPASALSAAAASSTSSTGFIAKAASKLAGSTSSPVKAAAAAAPVPATASAAAPPTAAASATPAKAAAPAAKAVKPPLKREDSNPFAVEEDDEVIDDDEEPPATPPAQSKAIAAKPAAAAAPAAKAATSTTKAAPSPSPTVKAAVPSPTPSPVVKSVAASPTPSPVVSASPAPKPSIVSSASSTPSSSSSRSGGAPPPTLHIDDSSESSPPLASPSSGPLSPASVKREVHYQQRLKKAITDASRIPLASFGDDFDAKRWTAGLTSPLFELIREKYPVEEEEEVKRREEEEEEEEDDEGDHEGHGEAEGLSEAELAQRRREAQLKRDGAQPRLRRRPFDPEPFSSLFSLALSRLDVLRDQLDASIVAGNAVTSRAEAEHGRRMAAFTSSLGSLTVRFQRLDARISSVSHTAVRIGSTLDHINTTKLHNIRAYDLITHFIAFNSGDASRISPLFSSPKVADMYTAAEVIQTLEGITQEVRVQGTEKAVQLIQRVSEECESNLLTRFEDALSRGAVLDMKNMAKTLLGFKGKNVIRRYVFAAMQQIEDNTRKALAEKGGEEQEEEEEEEDDEEVDEEGEDEETRVARRRMTEDSLASPQVALFRSSIRLYYRSIVSTLRLQCKVCSQVFPNPSTILRAIIERVFSDKVADFLDQALSKPKLRLEDELLILAAAQQQTEKLTQQLQQLIKQLPASAASSSSSTGSAAAGSFDVSTLTDMQSGVFQKYREAYIGKETAFLRQRCIAAIQPILASQHAEEGAAAPDGDFLGFKRRAAALSTKQRWLISALEHEVVDDSLKDLLVSLKRSDALSDPSAVADNAFAIFSVVLSCLVDEYVQPLYAQVVPFLPAADPKQEPDAFYFLCVRLLSSIADRLRQHYTYFILPRLTAQTNTQAVCEQRLREVLGAVEVDLLNGLQRCLSAQLRYLQKLLLKQKPNDYRPKDEEALFSGKPTAACSAVVDSMALAYECVVQHMEGANVDHYLQVLGLRCYDLLVEHLQKMQVSELGAGLLSRDCKEYEGMVVGWHMRDVVERFGQLRSVANLFFVSVDNLAAWVQQEARVKGMDREELMKFVRMRGDYQQHKSKITAILTA